MQLSTCPSGSPLLACLPAHPLVWLVFPVPDPTLGLNKVSVTDVPWYKQPYFIDTAPEAQYGTEYRGLLVHVLCSFSTAVGVLSLANSHLTVIGSPPLPLLTHPGTLSLWSTLSSVLLPQPLQCGVPPPPPLLQLSQSETHNLALNYTLCSLIILCLLSLARLSSSGSALLPDWLWSRTLRRAFAHRARGYSGICLEHRYLHLQATG